MLEDKDDCVPRPREASAFFKNMAQRRSDLEAATTCRGDRSADSHVRESQLNEQTRGLGGPRSEPLLESRLHTVERVPSEGSATASSATHKPVWQHIWFAKKPVRRCIANNE